mmetsp:Transcript_13731/g.27998  ORF Transcript_13731/g.27998 Transcript_13731/m.27998 type:complete len:259 (+) Transcript_13731:362-1138(+)
MRRIHRRQSLDGLSAQDLRALDHAPLPEHHVQRAPYPSREHLVHVRATLAINEYDPVADAHLLIGMRIVPLLHSAALVDLHNNKAIGIADHCEPGAVYRRRGDGHRQPPRQPCGGFVRLRGPLGRRLREDEIEVAAHPAEARHHARCGLLAVDRHDPQARAHPLPVVAPLVPLVHLPAWGDALHAYRVSCEHELDLQAEAFQPPAGQLQGDVLWLRRRAGRARAEGGQPRDPQHFDGDGLQPRARLEVLRGLRLQPEF